MNVLKYRVSLDMFDTHSQTTIKAKKRDSACEIHITLTEKGKIYNIGEGCSATLYAKKSNGDIVYDKCITEGKSNCSINNNTIVYNFASSIDDEYKVCQISSCEGVVECEVTLFNAQGEQLTSPRFTLFIDDTVYNEKDVMSTPEASVLQELFKEAEGIVEEMKEKAKTIDGKEDKINKADTLFVVEKDLEGKYPSALASKRYADSLGSTLTQKIQELEQMDTSLSQNKADKSQIGEIETVLGYKEDKSNKAETYDDIDRTSKTQYLSSKAVTGYLNNMYAGIEQTFQPQLDNKEDKSNRIDDLKVPQSDLVGKYPSALAVDDLAKTYNERLRHELELKVDKEEGKTLYRGMEVIYEHTITEEEVGLLEIIFDKDMSGNTFKLDEIYFYINGGTELTTAQSLSLIFNGGSGAAYYWFATTVQKGKKRLQAYGKRVKEKHWFNMQQAPCFSLYDTEFSGSYAMSSVDYVTKLEIDGLTNFPVGTKILFCGRRVD